MKTRVLGRSGISVGEIGYGAMGLTWAYGEPISPRNESDAIRLIHRAIEIGVTLFDTADVYGPFTSEELVGKALRDRRCAVVIATKCGIVPREKNASGPQQRNGSPAYIKAACDASLHRLGIDTIDLYQLHRVDPNVPVEESVGAMADLLAAGKIRAIGLSEVDVDTLVRASGVHPISTLQSELSSWTRDVVPEILPWCESNNVALLAYSPLGRGFLTGRLKPSDIKPGDFRATLPRFDAENFEANQRIVDTVNVLARKLGITSGQLALAWVLAQGRSVVPIPGTKRLPYLEENAAASAVVLPPDTVAALNALPPAAGGRYAT
ncbi:MAG: aldo/keto reductase [Candidatus Eremiobacteraeota bacterium]|nr:aldo/keto reductase [Candidatus Eremiobacteraeota bacterium]